MMRFIQIEEALISGEMSAVEEDQHNFFGVCIHVVIQVMQFSQNVICQGPRFWNNERSTSEKDLFGHRFPYFCLSDLQIEVLEAPPLTGKTKARSCP